MFCIELAAGQLKENNTTFRFYLEALQTGIHHYLLVDTLIRFLSQHGTIPHPRHLTL